MSITVRTPKEVTLGIAEQTTWGTPIGDSSAFDQLQSKMSPIQEDIFQAGRDGARGNRLEDVGEYVFHEKGAMPECPISDLWLPRSMTSLLLYTGMQQVTEEGTTPYKKTFTPHATQPDFSTAGQGKFITIIQKLPEASASRKICDAILKSMTLKWEPGASPLIFGGEFVGRGAVTRDANPSGTWTIPANAFWYHNDMVRATMNFGSPFSPTFGPLELTWLNNVFAVGQVSTGSKPETIGIKDHKGSVLKGSVMYDSDTDGLFGYWAAGTAGELNFGWGSGTPGSADGDLDITIYGVLTSVKFSEKDALMIDFEFLIAGSSSASKQPLTIIHADATHHLWGD